MTPVHDGRQLINIQRVLRVIKHQHVQEQQQQENLLSHTVPLPDPTSLVLLVHAVLSLFNVVLFDPVLSVISGSLLWSKRK